MGVILSYKKKHFYVWKIGFWQNNFLYESVPFSDWYNGNTIFDFSTPITTDIALTAKWTIETSPGEGDSTGGETGGNVATGGDSTGGETGGNVAPEGILYVTIVTSEGTYMQYEHPSIQTPYLLTEVDFGKIPLGTESQTTTFYITIIRATILNTTSRVSILC